jgi:hypothetical protein
MASKDYRKAEPTKDPAWEREMILEKAAYNLELLGFEDDAKILRVFRKGETELLEHLDDRLDIRLEIAEDIDLDEGENGEAFND